MNFTACFLNVFVILIMILTGCTGNRVGESVDTRERSPNIVYILADDMGYGDVSCYHAPGKIHTPHIDRLASQGMRFTDAHAPSSVCTPTRYALLTGEYAWRSRLPRGVLRGYGRALIPEQKPTVASLLRRAGYHTAVIGKWHLGLDWHVKPGHGDAFAPGAYGVSATGFVQDMDPAHIDFTVPPTGGPLSRGFDYSFILPASLDMDPYCYLQNDTLIELPDGWTAGNDLNTGYTGAFWRPGRMAPSFKFDKVLDIFTEKAVDYLKERSTTSSPFFLYLPLAAPHTPWVPSQEWQGKSQAGTYGDFVQMVDAAVGKVMTVLDSLNMDKNTLVVFTSDNGPYWRPEFVQRFGHRAAGPWKGMKADIWEGGHRIPFIVRWPGVVNAGSVSHATTALTNLMATCTEITGIQLPADEAVDSYSIFPVLKGKAEEVPLQRAIIHHSSQGHFAVRQGQWKYIEQRGSGGFSEPQRYEPGPGEPSGELYDLVSDPAEENNRFKDLPDQVAKMQGLLDSIRSASAGNAQPNRIKGTR